jgi:hypothetical protein
MEAVRHQEGAMGTLSGKHDSPYYYAHHEKPVIHVVSRMDHLCITSLIWLYMSQLQRLDNASDIVLVGLQQNPIY